MPSPPYLEDGDGAIAMQHAEVEVILLCQMVHAGDEGLIERAIVRLSANILEMVMSWLMAASSPTAGTGRHFHDRCEKMDATTVGLERGTGIGIAAEHLVLWPTLK